MYRIEADGSLILNRGECFELPLFINVGSEETPIRLDLAVLPSAEIYLGVYEANSNFENSVIAKKYTINDTNLFGDIIVNFTAKDTAYLRSGKYFYEVKLRLYDEINGEFIATVIKRTSCLII